MTNKERVETLLKHQKPDRVPIYPFAIGFSLVYSGASIADAYNRAEVALAAQRKAARDFDWVYMPFMGYGSIGAWEFGGEVKWPSGEYDQAPMVTRYPIETPGEVMSLRIPDIKSTGFIPHQTEFYRLSSQEGELDNKPFKAVIQIDRPFSVAANIAGPGNFTKWLLKEPEAAHRLLELTTEFYARLGQYWKDCFGTEEVIVWGGEATSSNQMISPKMFEKFALPYVKEIQERLLDMGYRNLFTHICGDQNMNLRYWAEIPMGDPGFVSFGHEVDLEKGAEYFPNDIIVGNLEPAIIQAGAPEEVYEASRGVIEKGKKLPGGFMFSPGCSMPPKARPENIRAITRAVEDFGWYE